MFLPRSWSMARGRLGGASLVSLFSGEPILVGAPCSIKQCQKKASIKLPS